MIKNKEKIKKYKARYSKERQRTDINFKLFITTRSRIRQAFSKQKFIRSKRTLELLGCSLEHARKHLESQFKEGMTWDNHGFKGWHIDHIIPCASFDLTDPEQQKKCFNYKNLQPLWWQENLSKGSKILN